MTGMPAGETARVRDDDGNPLFSYRSFTSAVPIVATVTSGIVVVAGFAAVLFLLAEKRPLPAIGALILSAAFALVIAMLVPPVTVTLFDGQQPLFTITQASRASFPVASYVVLTPDGHTIARLRKSVFARLGRNRWSIIDERGRPLGHASEESLGRAIVRKFLGKFNRKYEANVGIRVAESDAGTIVRRPDAKGCVDLLELPEGSPLDRRVAVALATLVLGSEP